jgi:hypothetical protein
MTFGYLDPGSGSLILQALLGGVAGMVVAFKAFKNKIPFARKRSQEPTTGAEPSDSPVYTET